MKAPICLGFFLIICFLSTLAQSSWTIELHGGQVYNVPMSLSISQQNYPVLSLKARYHTEPFTLPVYWDLRLSRWQKNKSWELELIHHKLYLNNTTPEITKFNISHGFNMLMINRGFEQASFRYHAGIGLVLSHPESLIRGIEFGDTTDDWDLGYFVSGPVVNLALAKPIRLSGRFFLNTEAKTTFAYSTIQVGQGHANVNNLAFHHILGLGVNLKKHKFY